METLKLFAIFAFLMAYYYFVLRRYNSLGFRLFSLFFFVGCFACYWWWVSDHALKSIEHTGISTNALVVQKTANDLAFRFTDRDGKTVDRTQKGGISIQEFATVSEGQTAPILYSPQSGTVYLAASYQRQLHDNIYLLAFPGMLFLIGLFCWIFLRKYRVHPHQGSLYEYVTDESGKVVLDDAATPATKALRNYSTLSRLFDLFRR